MTTGLRAALLPARFLSPSWPRQQIIGWPRWMRYCETKGRVTKWRESIGDFSFVDTCQTVRVYMRVCNFFCIRKLAQFFNVIVAVPCVCQGLAKSSLTILKTVSINKNIGYIKIISKITIDLYCYFILGKMAMLFCITFLSVPL